MARSVSEALSIGGPTRYDPPVIDQASFYDRLLAPQDSTTTPPEAPLADFLRATWAGATTPVREPIDTALLRAAAAPSPGFAVALAHQAAVRQLVPEVDPRDIVAVCITEADGNSPRAIETDLGPQGDTLSITGKKRWATLSPLADRLLVVGRRGWIGERADLVVVSVPTSRSGITIEPLRTPGDPLGLPHAEVQLESVLVRADEILRAEAHEALVKPMRLLEDLFGLAVSSVCRLRLALTRGAREHVERELALMTTIRQLAREPLDQASSHVAAAGALALGELVLREAQPLVERLSDAERQIWASCFASSRFARKPRQARRERAWQIVSGANDTAS